MINISYKLFSLILLLVSLLLAACDQPVSQAIKFGLSSSPITLDPRFATDAVSTRLNRLLYMPLVDFGEDFKPKPALATWKKLSDTRYRFFLGEEGRLFSSGVQLTANDVKATYDSVIDETTASPHRLSFKDIQNIRVIDKNTLEFNLEKPDLLFPGKLVIGILPESQIQHNHKFNRSPIGSGGFTLVDWPDSNLLILKRISDEKLFKFLTVTDPNVRVLKLVKGEIDMLQNDITPEHVNYLSGLENIQIKKRDGSNFSYLGFNLDDEITGRIEIRQAINYAINREAIIKFVLKSSAQAASALLPPHHWAGNPGLKNAEYAPEKARHLLSLIDDIPKPIKITYKTSSDPFRLRLASIIQQQLAEVGFDIQLKSYDWGTFFADVKSGNFQMYSLMWVGIKTPDIFRYVFHSESIPPNGANRGRLSNVSIDQMIDAAEAKNSYAKQAIVYRALQKEIYQQLPYVPLWYERHIFASRKEISGFEVASDGNYDGLIKVMKSSFVN